MNLRAPLFAVSLALAPCAAQTAAVTTPPHVVVETVGPDGWRVRFAPTNLGSLLESEQGRELWEPGVVPLLGWWRDVLGGDAAFAPVRERLLGYGGRVRLGIWFHEGLLSHQGPVAAALVLEGDGHTGLDALAGDVRRLQEELDGEWTEVELAGAKLEVRTQGQDRMTAPIVGEHHVLCVASAEDDLAAALADARAWVGTCDGKAPLPNTPALRIDVHTPQLLALARDAVANATDPAEWDTVVALGFECLGTSRLELTTAGPHVQVELAQQFADGPKGLFAALFAKTAGVPVLQRLLPPPGDRSSWKVGRFDALALYDAIEAAVAANDVDVDEMRTEIRDELGVDLRADLLAHLTDEVVLQGASFEDLRRLEVTPWSFAIRLRDRAAFEKAFTTAIAKAKPMLSREATIEHGDAKLHRYGNMLGYDLWLAIGGDLFVLAGGADAEDRLKALFDAAKAPVPEAMPAVPTSHENLERHLPPGLHGVAQGDLDSLAALPVAWWLYALGEVGATRDMGPTWDDERQQALRELLQQHRLDVLRTATGYAANTWRWRLFW